MSRTRHAGVFGIKDVTLIFLPAHQDFTDFSNGEFAEGLVVDVLLGENVLIHAVDSIANHFPGGVGRNLELYSILLIVEESVRAFQLFNEITPQRQFFGRLHHTILIGIEHIGFDSGITAVGVDHGHAFPASIIIQLIDGKCSIGQLDSLASLGVHLD